MGASLAGGISATMVWSFFRVSGLTSAGPRFPWPAFQPAQRAKSSTDMWAIPAGPITAGLSAMGPASIGLILPPMKACGRGASTRPRVHCGPRPAVRSASGSKIHSTISSSQLRPARRSIMAPTMV